MNKVNLPWVVVECAGREDEAEVNAFRHFIDADEWIARTYEEDEIEFLGVDIMKRLDDGTLTTEY
jgi:tRNA(Ile2) C34 agmatinyltransferase TiaS